ncbi:MAG: lysylphosphatidylglycerol synthase transmembrane domain-containing protein [Candidatus Marinimicrobia bacterium]|nr:lysylphosphatidylglycerol synthase transmembrane domain-containing protein [Candidatus Neomarinimicrobiota bacterium]
MTEEYKGKKISGYFGLIIKVIISTLILYVLFSQFDIILLSEKIGKISRLKLALVVILGFILWLTEYLRFYVTLKPVLHDGNIKLWRVFFSGYALRFVFPGGHGEVGKMLFVSGRYSQRVWAYLMDKGSFGLVVLISLIVSGWFYFPEHRVYFCLGFGLTVIFSVILLIVFRKRNVFTTNSRYPFHKILPPALGLSVLQVMIITVQYWLILYGENISIGVVFSTVCAILVVIMIPISFGGLGVREWTTLQILKQFQVSREIAIITPLAVFFTNVLLPAIIGAGVIIFFKMKISIPPKREAQKCAKT